MRNTSSIRPIRSMQYRLVADRRTHDDSKYQASIASRGKNQPLSIEDRRQTDRAAGFNTDYSTLLILTVTLT